MIFNIIELISKMNQTNSKVLLTAIAITGLTGFSVFTTTMSEIEKQKIRHQEDMEEQEEKNHKRKIENTKVLIMLRSISNDLEPIKQHYIQKGMNAQTRRN